MNNCTRAEGTVKTHLWEFLFRNGNFVILKGFTMASHLYGLAA